MTGDQFAHSLFSIKLSLRSKTKLEICQRRAEMMRAKDALISAGVSGAQVDVGRDEEAAEPDHQRKKGARAAADES